MSFKIKIDKLKGQEVEISVNHTKAIAIAKKTKQFMVMGHYIVMQTEAGLTCAGSGRSVQRGPEVIVLTHTHHRAFFFGLAVRWTRETLLLSRRHLIRARGTGWREKHTDPSQPNLELIEELNTSLKNGITYNLRPEQVRWL